MTANPAAPAPPAHRWRLREREWAHFALALAAMALLFSAWPALDLLASALFHDRTLGFVGDRVWLVEAFYRGVPWVGRAGALMALIVAVACWRRPGLGIGPCWRRRWFGFGLAMLLGVGLLVNGVLKEGWGRPRPAAIAPFGGAASFEPALRPGAQCRTNCSFVSGHAATGYALMGFGLIGSDATRRRWWRAGLVAGVAIGLARMAQGGHFLSDVLFSGLAIWGVCLLLREGWLVRLAWRRSRRRQRLPLAA